MQNFPKVPKVREYAELELADGTTMTGYMFVDATSRISDVLNGAAPFFPFVDQEERVFLLNKSAVVRVRPFDK